MRSILRLTLGVLFSLSTLTPAFAQTETVWATDVPGNSSWTRPRRAEGQPPNRDCNMSNPDYAYNTSDGVWLSALDFTNMAIPGGLAVDTVVVAVLARYNMNHSGQVTHRVEWSRWGGNTQTHNFVHALDTAGGSCGWEEKDISTLETAWRMEELNSLRQHVRRLSSPSGSWLRVKGFRIRVTFGADCNGDGIADRRQTDTDGDGLIDLCDPCPLDVNNSDSDNDGTPDCDDECPNDPLKILRGACGCGTPDTDSDGDGVLDCMEECDFDPNKTAPGICGCGTPDTDTDGDGVPDCIDGCPLDPGKTNPGTCGCGVPDLDSDGDGFADCIEDCDNDPNKTSPGACGCGNPETDSDNDTVPDCIDQCPGFDDRIDCNNNNIPDACEMFADCNNNSIPDECDIASGFSLDLNGDGLPDECQLCTPFCFCPDLGPCGNSDPASGCVNSSFFGSRLECSGSTSVTSDDLVLSARDLPNNQFGIFFMGNTDVMPLAFGDGLRCVGGNLWRYPATSSGASGTLEMTSVVGASINYLPTVGHITAGATWSFQAWFRDVQGPCGTGFNTSSAMRVLFTP